MEMKKPHYIRIPLFRELYVRRLQRDYSELPGALLD